MATKLMVVIVIICSAVLSTSLVAGSYDLSVVSVTRTLSDDRKQMTITAEYTASEEPRVEFRTYYETLKGTVTEYSNGRGRTSTSFPAPDWSVVILKIGHFDSHYVDIYMDLKKERYQQLSVTQTLNTRPTPVTPGYDVTYIPGESFDITAVVPWHPATNFTWRVFEDRDSNDVNAQLTGAYLDTATGEVVKSKEFPSIGNFLHVNKTYKYDEGATLKMSFTTAQAPVYGYFQLYSFSSFDYPADPTYFVTDLEENIMMKVHEEGTPGPFPAGYNYVKAFSLPARCFADSPSCFVRCEGYSNHIADFGVFKVEKDGTETNMIEADLTRETGKHYVRYVSSRQNNPGGATGKYLCKIWSRDGTSASAEETLFAD